MAEINREVLSVSAAFSEINMATEELSNGGEQITEAMYILQDVSQKVMSGAIEIKNGAIGMGESMNDVKKISSSVLEKVIDISSDSKLIAAGTESISNIAEEFTNNTLQLDEKIKMFVY